jgi:hypothetical protein
MRRFVLSILVLLCLAMCACKNDFGVGDPCVPEMVPCDANGKNCGFRRSETYLQSDAPSCEARACIVFRLDNGTNDQLPADPRVICEEDDSAGCVPQAALDMGSHCTCRCDGAKGAADRCECPDGFACRALSTNASDADRGSYCVRRQ